jgi:hypothetical protein
MMKSSIRLFLLIFPALALLLMGCAGVPSTPTHQIELFRDGQTPMRAYREIRLLTDDGGLGEQGQIEEKFIDKAKRLGGDALIIHPVAHTGAELKGFALVETYLYKASVIVYDRPQ